MTPSTLENFRNFHDAKVEGYEFVAHITSVAELQAAMVKHGPGGGPKSSQIAEKDVIWFVFCVIIVVGSVCVHIVVVLFNIPFQFTRRIIHVNALLLCTCVFRADDFAVRSLASHLNLELLIVDLARSAVLFSPVSSRSQRQPSQSKESVPLHRS